jgi:hypothetical protein
MCHEYRGIADDDHGEIAARGTNRAERNSKLEIRMTESPVFRISDFEFDSSFEFPWWPVIIEMPPLIG